MDRVKKSDITKSKILAAAELEFSEGGLFGARIDSIAANAGVNKRMIYEHFVSHRLRQSLSVTKRGLNA